MSGEDDEYTLVNKQELDSLQKQLDEVKKNPLGDVESSLTLIESMDKLSSQIDRLLAVFEKASKDMHQEYLDGLRAESGRLDQIISQNQRIAKGVLSLAKQSDSDTSTNASDDTIESPDLQSPKKRSSLMREFR